MVNTFTPLPTSAALGGVDGTNKDKEVQVGALNVAGTLLTATPAQLNEMASAHAVNTTDIALVAADALVIPVTARVVRKTTGADAEALTLGDGNYEGQRLTIVLVTDGGGDATLTPDTPADFATIVFADAGDRVTLEWQSFNGWILVGAVGVAAPPAITI